MIYGLQSTTPRKHMFGANIEHFSGLSHGGKDHQLAMGLYVYVSGPIAEYRADVWWWGAVR